MNINISLYDALCMVLERKLNTGMFQIGHKIIRKSFGTDGKKQYILYEIDSYPEYFKEIKDIMEEILPWDIEDLLKMIPDGTDMLRVEAIEEKLKEDEL